MRNVSEQIFRENKPPYYIQRLFFLKKICRLWDNVEEYIRARHTTNDNMPYANSHKLAFRICKMYSFSTATM